MNRSRGPRVVRGLAAASVATFVALFSHVVGGGAMPAAVGVLVPWVLAVLVCIALVGRTASLPRLGASVAVSQLLFHALFVLGAGGSPSSAAAHHSHGTRTLAFEPSGVEYGDAGMWAAHVVAAVATVLLLHRGEVAIRGLLRLGGELSAAARRGIRLLVSPVPAPGRAGRVLPRPPVRAVRPLDRHPGSLARRGPPAALAL